VEVQAEKSAWTSCDNPTSLICQPEGCHFGLKKAQKYQTSTSNSFRKGVFALRDTPSIYFTGAAAVFSAKAFPVFRFQ